MKVNDRLHLLPEGRSVGKLLSKIYELADDQFLSLARDHLEDEVVHVLLRQLQFANEVHELG